VSLEPLFDALAAAYPDLAGELRELWGTVQFASTALMQRRQIVLFLFSDFAALRSVQSGTASNCGDKLLLAWPLSGK
jgi:hypothetical protein